MRAQTRTLLQSNGPLMLPTPVPAPSHRPVRRSNLISISKGGSNLSFTILRCVARTGALVSAVTLAAWLAAAHAAVPDIPTVEGPITGPGEMQPSIRPGPGGTNLEDFGYVMEEYFVSGVAAGQPYKTRLLLRKPPNPEKFSGVLVGEPTHRGGNGLICQFARFGIAQRGHACMTVAARRINLSNPATPGAGLYEFNLERYGSLRVADNQANEIIAQVGRLLRENLAGGPMGQYTVRNIVLTGTSDSSGATRIYMSSGPMLDHADLRMPDGGPIYQGYFISSILGSGLVPTIADAPVIQMPTQFELHSTNGFRRPTATSRPTVSAATRCLECRTTTRARTRPLRAARTRISASFRTGR